MRPNQLTLRCYGERDGDLWVAVCIDLCLAAQASSFEDARRKLHEQIGEYVYDALVGEDGAHATQLLSRKAPINFFLKYYFYSVLGHLAKVRQKVKLFSEMLPVQPTHQPC